MIDKTDKKAHIMPYVYGMLAGFGAISLSILFFFLIYRFDGLGSAFSSLTGILMPFIYGSVIAYLLKPVCNTAENFLRRVLPARMRRAAVPLAVTATMLFGLLVVYALLMMIVPQLITSVTTLYYTAQENIGRFIDWISTQEFFTNNAELLLKIEELYDKASEMLDTWVRTKFMPSIQNIVSGVGTGVINVVIVFKNLFIGLVVTVYLLASRKRFTQQAKLIVCSLLKPRWAELVLEEVRYADKMFGGSG